MSVTPDPKLGSEFSQKRGITTVKHCIQCGKCSSVCPLVRHREHYSPIEVIKSVLLGLKDIVISSDEIWLCLSCQACTRICPAGIKFQDFMNVLRGILEGKGVTHYIQRCRRCGREFTTTPVLRFAEKLLPKEIRIDEEYLMLCPDCKAYAILAKSAPWYGKGMV